ncbi:MAG: Na(+)/H(+) antiporter subunit D [Nitriliruptoraceae bacterium]
MSDLLLHPILPFVVGAVLVRLLPHTLGHVVMVLAPVVAMTQIWQLEAGTSVQVDYLDWQLEVLRADGLSTPFGVVFAIAALIAGIYGIATQRGPERSAALLYAGAAFGVVYAGDLLTFFLFWETKAIASTFLILARRTARSGRSGMRYLFVHIFGGKLLLAGIIVHVWQTDSLSFTTFEPGVAAYLIMVACLLSAAVPPLHAWLADAYPEATVAGTVFLSAYTTKAAVYALARGFPGFDILIYLGVIMALYGVVYAVLENDIRRLLGYHIVSQVGYMVAAVGIGTELAINGATAHAFAHILYKGLLLMGAGAVLYATGRAKMSELGGIANRMRLVLALYMVGAVSISSFPLFSGFVSKELVVASASAGDLTWLVVLLKVASVGTFLHTGLKLPFGTWIGKKGLGPRLNGEGPVFVGAVPASMIAAMALSASLNFLLGIRPQLLYDLLPYAVTYDVYTFGKVVEKLQILLFTALAFWLLLPKLHAKAVVSVDTDWVYRKLPGYLRDLWRRLVPPTPHSGRPSEPSSRVATEPVEPVAGPAPAEPVGGPAPAEPVGGPARVGAADAADAAAAEAHHADATDAPDAATPSTAAATTATATRRRVGTPTRLFSPVAGPPPLIATWVLGGLMLLGAIIVLFTSLTP